MENQEKEQDLDFGAFEELDYFYFSFGILRESLSSVDERWKTLLLSI